MREDSTGGRGKISKDLRNNSGVATTAVRWPEEESGPLKSSRPEGAQEEHRERAPTSRISLGNLDRRWIGRNAQRLRMGARVQEAQEEQSQLSDRPIESISFQGQEAAEGECTRRTYLGR
jgi:hypothetical protein